MYILNLDDLIEFEEEHTCLDFKSKEYNKDNVTDLIKDVMSMANSLDSNTKRIIIGVKHTPGEEKEFLGIEEISDQATLENIIQENIEPTINFRYFKHIFKGVNLGIIEISNNNDRPYMMKKDYGKGLKRGDAWIRKGSRQSRLGRPELDEIQRNKKSLVFDNKIIIGCGEELKKEIIIKKSKAKRDLLPSVVEKKHLEKLVKKLDNRYGSDNGVSKSNIIHSPERGFLFGEFNDDDKSIMAGKGFYNLPVYKTKEELLKDIENISDIYYDCDCYYIFEECSYKFNCMIYNDGLEFLEDVVIEMFFDKEIFLVSDKIYTKNDDSNPLYIKIKTPKNEYPQIKKLDDSVVAIASYDKIRHKTLTQIFKEDLRILIKPEVSLKETEIKYRISAKNLPNIFEGSIKVLIH